MLSITKMRVGLPDADGLLVSLSIGDPDEAISPEMVSMTVRVNSGLWARPEDLQVEALKRCAQVVGEQIAQSQEQKSVGDPCCDNVVCLSRPRTP
jgi:hypothetical protein